METTLRTIFIFIATTICLQIVGCGHTANVNKNAPIPSLIGGKIIRYNPALEAIIPSNTPIELLSQGHGWTEGPVWVTNKNHLLFSQPRENQLYVWSPELGVDLFLDPSGLPDPNPELFRAPGINGSFISPDGTLISADQGHRAIVAINTNSGERVILATHYDGKRLNGPNDLVVSRSGAVYFTDPGSALVGGKNSPLRELSYNGVYRLDTNGTVSLISNSIESPNGIALSPDEHTLYVANAQARNAVWMALDLNDNGDKIGDPRVFYSLQEQKNAGLPGLPDGLAVDNKGNIFATGPGGVYVINPSGKLLGFIDKNDKTSNCAFGGTDGRTLFITSNGVLSQVRTTTTGLNF